MFQVRWKHSAVNDLAAIWTASDSGQRQAITAAASTIDQILSIAPNSQGESRPNGRRVLLVAPLGVTFRVDNRHMTVWVLRVWRFRVSR